LRTSLYYHILPEKKVDTYLSGVLENQFGD